MRIRADFHIHSALSPCASLEMSPRAIVERAIQEKLDLISISDHNSMENSFQAAPIAEKYGLWFVYGMEVQTREDVHVLCLFSARNKAERFNTWIYDRLPAVENDAVFFGDQVVVDGSDEVVRFEPKLLLNALDLSLPELVDEVNSRNGFLIPSHVECSPFGLLPALGFIPSELKDTIMELSSMSEPGEIMRIYPELESIPLIGNSDAHYLRDIGRCFTEYETGRRSLREIYQSGLKGNFRRIRQGVHG